MEIQSSQSTLICLKPSPKLSGLPPIASGNSLIKDDTIAKPQEVVEGWIHKATKTVLASASKAGKTWLLLLLALCVATGMKFLGLYTTRGKVLFINLEIQPAFITERLRALMKHLGISDCGDLDFWNLRGMTADVEALVAHIIKETEGKGYSLIIIDPYYKLMNGKSENGSGAVSAFCHLLERLAEKTGAAVVYSHHFAKGNPKKKASMDRMSGSGVFARDADTIITLTEHTETDCYTVETTLRNLPPKPAFVVQWEYPVMVEREDLDPEDVLIAEVEDEDDHGLADVIRARPHTTQEWQMKALALGISRSTFYRIKRKLKEQGHIKFNFNTKTWSLVKESRAETCETVETCETACAVKQ